MRQGGWVPGRFCSPIRRLCGIVDFSHLSDVPGSQLQSVGRRSSISRRLDVASFPFPVRLCRAPNDRDAARAAERGRGQGMPAPAGLTWTHGHPNRHGMPTSTCFRHRANPWRRSPVIADPLCVKPEAISASAIKCRLFSGTSASPQDGGHYVINMSRMTATQRRW